MNTAPEAKPGKRNVFKEHPSTLRGLILDDSAVDRMRMKRLCQKAELDISFSEASTISEFARKIDGSTFEVVLLDYRLVQGDGLIALEMLKRHPRQRKTASIMVAGESQIQVAIDAMKNGCADFLLKDMMGPEMLSRSIAQALASNDDHRPSQNDENRIDGALVRFANHSAAEMQSILSSMLRRTRALRHAAQNEQPANVDEVGKIDENCARLWEFLEEYRAFVGELGKPQQRFH